MTNPSETTTPVAPNLQHIYSRSHAGEDDLGVNRKDLDRKCSVDVEGEVRER